MLRVNFLLAVPAHRTDSVPSRGAPRPHRAAQRWDRCQRRRSATPRCASWETALWSERRFVARSERPLRTAPTRPPASPAQLGSAASLPLTRAFSMISRARNDRVTLRLRASLVSVAWSPAGSLTVRTFIRGGYYAQLQSAIRMEFFAHRASADSAHERTRRGLPDNRNGDTHRYRIADAAQDDFPWHGVRSVTNGRGAGCCRRLKSADTGDSSRTD